ncbi:sarcoplasmic calcium-binding protein-like [Ruditapes philippinarum]|uniref:sarcoplasmic calcium-binding protein-like n=1 Tax=Ruditapes philippinarum TaxID=129788 RepID=UPI00295AE2BA|nr:sarcoplasmic calcium-binding protein-like [Ruditapes philippinarum]
MANDYIISKWKLWFRAIDINHKGKISRSDVRQEEDTFATLSHLNDDRRKQLQVDLDKLWDEVVFRGKSEPINEQEFVALNIRDYTANKQKFVEGIRKAYTALFDLIDVSREGSVSEEEFVNILRACGHDNIALNKKFFNDYNPVDGKIACGVLVDSWVQFTSCDDSSKKDLIKEAFEAGI